MSETSAGVREQFELDILGDKPMINNRVLVKVDFVPEDGVKFGNIYLAGAKWNEAGRVARYGVVVKAPERLVGIWEKEFDGAMEWKTDMEVQVGDTVFFNKMESANAPAIVIGDSLYYIIRYSEIILRVRNGEIYPLNGYAVVTKVVETVRVSGLILDFGDFQDKRLGVVKYLGKPNDFYHGTKSVDADVAVGETAVFEGSWYTDLENGVFATLEKDLGYIQRCWIIGTL